MKKTKYLHINPKNTAMLKAWTEDGNTPCRFPNIGPSIWYRNGDIIYEDN